MDPKEAQRRYDDAKYDRNRARRREDDARNQRSSAQSELRSAKSGKHHLDDRLSDLNRVIRFFDETLTDQIQRTNTKAEDADRSYRGAIVCTNSGIAVASISSTFNTASVSDDANTRMAYQDCVRERDRVSRAILELDNTITRLNREIDNLSSDIRRYSNLASDYQRNMNYYARYF